MGSIGYEGNEDGKGQLADCVLIGERRTYYFYDDSTERFSVLVPLALSEVF